MLPNWSTKENDKYMKLYKQKTLVRNTAEYIFIKSLSLELTHNKS